MADRPTNTGREDTVALPLPKRPSPAAPAPGPVDGSNGRVMPPMPPGDSSGNGARNGSSGSTSAPAAPQTRPTRTAAKKTAKPPAKPRPASPPAQARKAAPAAAAPSAKPDATKPAQPAPSAAAQTSPATQATPVARTTEPARPAAAPPVVAPAPVGKSSPAQEARPAKEQRQARADRKADQAAAAPRPGRRARLRLTRIDPWSVMKTSFLLSIALGIVIVVSVLMVWTVLGAADVWASINQTVQDVVGGQESSTFDIEDYLGTRRVVGFTMIVAAVDVVLVTAICTLGAFLYNMSASLLGGIEVTLAEDN